MEKKHTLRHEEKNPIITTYIHPPIPVRSMDWEAIRKDYEGGDLRGEGSTREEAISDLLLQEMEADL